MTEIDWSRVPDGYDWAATDESGAVWVFKRKPKDGFCMWYDEDGKNEIRISDSVHGGYKGGSWRNSLIHRPSSACQEFPEHEVNEEYKVSEHDVFIKDRTVDEIAADDAHSLVDSVSELVQAYRNAVAELRGFRQDNRNLSLQVEGLKETLAELRKKLRGLIDE